MTDPVQPPGSSSEDDLIASNNRLRVLLACTKGIVFEFDRDARYLEVWTHDEALLARPRAEMLGRTIDEVLGPQQGARFTQAVQRVFDTGCSETLDYELVVQGGRRWFLADVHRSPGVGNRDDTVVYLIRDITAHKHLEEQLRQAQKMEAVGQLAGGIAHDFNNILTTVLGYSEMLVAGLDDRPVHRRYAASIRDSANRAAALVGQLLAYSRKQILEPEVLDVNEVISRMGEMLRPLIGENIELQLEFDPDLTGARVDRNGLEQILMNLAINARDAIAEGGVLKFATRNVDLDAGFCAQRVGLTPGQYIEILAHDTGHGMEAATRERIFEPFFTTKEFGKGTGLGLSIVYGIVKQSGGEVEVESEPGRGASFRVYLPRADHHTRADRQPDANPQSRTSGPSRVLVVEDDPEVRLLLDVTLVNAGYDVLAAADPTQALDLVSERAVDLLITDIMLPRMRGYALARQLCELQPGIRVLYITGYAAESPTEHEQRLAHSRFLAKPFSRQRLLGEVRALLEDSV